MSFGRSVAPLALLGALLLVVLPALVSAQSECPSDAPYVCYPFPPPGTFNASVHCMANLTLCGVPVQCSGNTSTPFACGDGVCRERPEDCRTAAADATCSAVAEWPYLCWDGTCAASAERCATIPRCPVRFQRRCLDGSCRASCEAIVPFDSATSQWDAAARRCRNGTTCADGRCQPSGECSPYNGCPPGGKPYHCADGSCGESKRSCRRECGGGKYQCATKKCYSESRMLNSTACADPPLFVQAMRFGVFVNVSDSVAVTAPRADNISLEAVTLVIFRGSYRIDDAASEAANITRQSALLRVDSTPFSQATRFDKPSTWSDHEVLPLMAYTPLIRAAFVTVNDTPDATVETRGSAPLIEWYTQPRFLQRSHQPKRSCFGWAGTQKSAASDGDWRCLDFVLDKRRFANDSTTYYRGRTAALRLSERESTFVVFDNFKPKRIIPNWGSALFIVCCVPFVILCALLCTNWDRPRELFWCRKCSCC